jgi:hypothetical protein
MSSTPKPTVEGWERIVAYLQVRAPVSISTDSAMRYARRLTNPLPVQRWGPRLRPRVFAYAEDLDSWLAQQLWSDGAKP